MSRARRESPHVANPVDFPLIAYADGKETSVLTIRVGECANRLSETFGRTLGFALVTLAFKVLRTQRREIRRAMEIPQCNYSLVPSIRGACWIRCAHSSFRRVATVIVITLRGHPDQPPNRDRILPNSRTLGLDQDSGTRAMNGNSQPHEPESVSQLPTLKTGRRPAGPISVETFWLRWPMADAVTFTLPAGTMSGSK